MHMDTSSFYHAGAGCHRAGRGRAGRGRAGRALGVVFRHDGERDISWCLDAKNTKYSGYGEPAADHDHGFTPLMMAVRAGTRLVRWSRKPNSNRSLFSCQLSALGFLFSVLCSDVCHRCGC